MNTKKRWKEELDQLELCEDEYARENGKWRIAKRKSVFDWQDKQELKN